MAPGKMANAGRDEQAGWKIEAMDKPYAMLLDVSPQGEGLQNGVEG